MAQPNWKTLISGTLIATALLWQPSAPAQTATPAFVEKFATPALLKQLQTGGLVLYMRHGNTDNSKPDAVPKVDLNDCATQRPLNDEGRRTAAQVGKYIHAAKIPIREVFHSPLCRARESAQLAFGPYKHTLHQELNLMYVGNFTSEEKIPVLTRTRALLSEPVAAGRNRVLVAHAPNLADLMGYFVNPEGTVVVIKPLGNGKFDYLASIPPGMWPALLAP